MPSLSVVIPCKDDAGPLTRCLESLGSQTLAPLEIIVVDNNSTDNSADVARRFRATVVQEPIPGIAAAASTGYDAARGDVIVRCDADSLIPADWLQRIAARFDAEPDLAVLTGPGVFYGTSRLRARIAAVAYMQGYFLCMGAAMGHWPPFGSNLAMRRSDWLLVRERLHRHDPDVHDDVDLGFALEPHQRSAYDRSLKVGISARALAGGMKGWVRFTRAVHTLALAWRQVPPWERWRRTLRENRDRRRRALPRE